MSLSPTGLPHSLRILLVENHDDTRKYLAMYLERAGHLVTKAATMKEGLEAIAKGEFDVLLSDIGLPDGDGWSLLRRAKFSRPVYSVAMSGFGMPTDHEKSRASGYRHHLLKPFGVDELEKLLALAAAEMANASVTSGS